MGSPPGMGVPIEPPGVHLPTLNPNIEDFIMRCLAEDPAARYATGREALDELNAVMPHTSKTDSGPFATGGDSILASLVEQVSQWREFRQALTKVTQPPRINVHLWIAMAMLAAIAALGILMAAGVIRPDFWSAW